MKRYLKEKQEFRVRVKGIA